MPLRSFKEIPKDLVEWGRYFQSLVVTPDPDSVNQNIIQDRAVTYQKIQNVTSDRLLGRDTAPDGAVQELTVSGGLEFTGSGIQRSALTGDVTAAAGSVSTTIAANVVTYAKIQDVSATDRLLGRSTAGAGDIEEIVCTAAGRALLDDAAASNQRTTLGLGTAATQDIANLTVPPVLPTYTVSTLPDVAVYARGLIYVSNETGGAVVAFSDGTNWRRVTDRAVVS
jgi:hypothetical protein